MSIAFNSNVPAVLQAEAALKRQILDAIGVEMSGDAKELTPVELGRLRSSITWAADEDSVTIGTNVEYAIYVHENLTAYHRIGQAKYLETAVREGRARIQQLINVGLQGQLPTT